VHTQASFGPLRIAYAVPAHLGVDRFLALLDACGNGPALVVGVGTALTVDLVDAAGCHRGGRIAPSPMLMRAALHARAPVLQVDGGAYAEFADDTVPALASGCEGAAIALVERSLAQATTLLGVAPALRLHGGGAVALRALLPAHVWVPDAVLRGIARWHASAFA
jgi:type III pantothenate kinase